MQLTTLNTSSEETLVENQGYSSCPDEIEIVVSKEPSSNRNNKPKSSGKDASCKIGRNCISLTTLAFLTLSLIIGVTIYLLIGNLPKFENAQVQLDQSGGSDGISINPQASPLSIQLNLLITGELNSQSYITFTVDRINVNVQLASAAAKPFLGSGETPEPVVIPARSTAKLSMPIHMDLQGDSNNPLISSILNSCGIGNGGSRSPIVVEYQVFVDVFWFKNMHVLTEQMSLDCPDLNGINVNLPLVGGINVGRTANTVGAVVGGVANGSVGKQVGQVIGSEPVQNTAGQVGSVFTGLF